MDEIIQEIKIDADGKYILIIDQRLSMRESDTITKQLQKWWNSDHKFFVLDVYSGVKVHLERMD